MSTSTSGSGALQHDIPMQLMHISEHTIPTFLHPHAFPQPLMHAQLIKFINFRGAGGWSVAIGIRVWSITCHPHSVNAWMNNIYCLISPNVSWISLTLNNVVGLSWQSIYKFMEGVARATRMANKSVTVYIVHPRIHRV